MKTALKPVVMESVEELRVYSDSPYPILSLYLGWEKKTPPVSRLVSQARSLFKSQLRPYEQLVFRSDLKKILSFLRTSFDGHDHRGVAFFMARDHLWETRSLDFFVPGICLVSHSPYLQPFDQQANQRSRYGIVLFDREKAEFLLIESGKIKRLDFFKDGLVPPPFKPKKEWFGRDSKVSRQIRGKLHHHLELIAQRFKKFLKESPADKVVLGGHRENFHELEDALGKKITGEIVATVPVDFKQDLDRIVNKCLEAAR